MRSGDGASSRGDRAVAVATTKMPQLPIPSPTREVVPDTQALSTELEELEHDDELRGTRVFRELESFPFVEKVVVRVITTGVSVVEVWCAGAEGHRVRPVAVVCCPGRVNVGIAPRVLDEVSIELYHVPLIGATALLPGARRLERGIGAGLPPSALAPVSERSPSERSG